MENFENLRKNIINNTYIFKHFLKLQVELIRENSNNVISNIVFNAMSESPQITLWIKEIIIPGIYDGDEGLESILLNIESEKKSQIKAIKFQILINILNSLSDSLENIKNGVILGEYSLNENLEVFEKEKREFKYLN